jgi:hypothetical protein
MQLQIKQSKQNIYPIRAILIKGETPSLWIEEIERLGFALSNVDCYPVPNTVPNSIWGCLLVTKEVLKVKNIGKNQYCQCIDNLLFLPEKAKLYPSVSAKELEELLLSKSYLMHPDFGMVELFEVIQWADFIAPIHNQQATLKRPISSVFIPKRIKTFQVHALSAEELLQQLEKYTFSKGKPLDEPLSPTEKARLVLLKRLFKQHKEGNTTITEKNGLMGTLESLKNTFLGKEGSNWSDALQEEYEDLEKRNQKELDKLLDLLKNNPEEALKYAIPLSNTGLGRGKSIEMGGAWNLSQRWNNFSLSSKQVNWGTLGGSASMQEDSFYQLQAQYRATAEQLIREKKYRKAAFVYLKLLQDYRKAAETLEAGKLYQEAASVYLKHCDNKEKAAICYHKGNMHKKAIELYKELEQYELVGDLYLELQHKKDAFFYYDKVIKDHQKMGRYLRASFLAKDKMEAIARAQNLLLEGWRNNSDAFNCLNNYFANINDLNLVKVELRDIYKNEVTDRNANTFLRVIKYEFKKQNDLAPYIREIAYEIIAQQASFNPSIIQQLTVFNNGDKNIAKDILRYSHKRK